MEVLHEVVGDSPHYKAETRFAIKSLHKEAHRQDSESARLPDAQAAMSRRTENAKYSTGDTDRAGRNRFPSTVAWDMEHHIQHTSYMAVLIYSSSVSNDRRPQALRHSLTSGWQSRLRLLISAAITGGRAGYCQKHHVSLQ